MSTNKRSASLLLFLLAGLFLPVLLNSCKPKIDSERLIFADTVTVDTTAADTSGGGSYQASFEIATDYIRFNGSRQDEVRNSLETFAPFASVAKLARHYNRLKDSLETLRQQYGVLTDPKDTLFLLPFKEKAYEAILNYKNQMASGRAVDYRCPSLLELTRVTEAEDSSLSLLPEAGHSDLLADGNFFFIGGAPFIYKLDSDENTVVTDLQGKPETRFRTSLTENVNYLITSVYHAKPRPINIEYGDPLYGYESGAQEVYGIGTLIHNFIQRIPAFFITEGGLLPAHLVSVKLNLVEEYNCGSGPTEIELACSRNIEGHEILGVYIPYGTTPASYTFNRLSDQVWTADLNNDGIADLACVSEKSSSEGSIAELLWFANINGTWKILDWAIEPECT